MAFFNLVGGGAGIIAIVTLLYMEWQRRAEKYARETVGLTIYLDTPGIAVDEGDGKLRRLHKPRLVPTGPGVWRDVRPTVWGVEPDRWKGQVSSVRELSCTSDPLSVELHLTLAEEHRAWFGVTHSTTYWRGLRTEAVRANLGNGIIEHWRWRRPGWFWGWLEGQRWLRLLGGGKKRRRGRWIRVREGSLEDWQGPSYDSSRPTNPEYPSETPQR